ncbi:MAG: hypothetical protein K0S18_290 [Anaerocolumna sp.]|jgi:hypothetical protein|nr:hypothetical protein [Anaerocolumna sp.]
MKDESRKNNEINNQNNNFKGEIIMKTNTLTTQEDFNGTIVLSLEAFYCEEYRIKVNKIVKNNDTLLYGLCILEVGTSIAPTIYLNKYFDEYRYGRTMDSILKEISHIYEQSKKPNMQVNITDITDFNKVKNHIVFKLVNRKRNNDFLRDIPFVSFCDLTVIFNIMVSADAEGTASITVKNNLIDYWKVDVDTLYKIAKENTEKLLPAKIQSMNEVIKEIFRSDMGSDMLSDTDFDTFYKEMIGDNSEPTMYIARNSNGINGATVMLYDGLIRDFARKIGKDLFIIPSSIHEIIMVPDNGSMDADDIKNMVVDVNSSQVAPEEVLSDSVYLYNRDNDSIILV